MKACHCAVPVVLCLCWSSTTDPPFYLSFSFLQPLLSVLLTSPSWKDLFSTLTSDFIIVIWALFKGLPTRNLLQDECSGTDLTADRKSWLKKPKVHSGAYKLLRHPGGNSQGNLPAVCAGSFTCQPLRRCAVSSAFPASAGREVTVYCCGKNNCHNIQLSIASVDFSFHAKSP